MKPVYRSDFGQWTVPDDVPRAPTKKDGGLDMRFRASRECSRYCAAQVVRQKECFMKGTDFKPQTYAEWNAA